ncbi:hypothetical protein M8C21_022636, partial [Ambrosia artemisiifolia]
RAKRGISSNAFGCPSNQDTNYFRKTLTATDTCTHDRFSVRRRVAESISPLDCCPWDRLLQFHSLGLEKESQNVKREGYTNIKHSSKRLLLLWDILTSTDCLKVASEGRVVIGLIHQNNATNKRYNQGMATKGYGLKSDDHIVPQINVYMILLLEFVHL